MVPFSPKQVLFAKTVLRVSMAIQTVGNRANAANVTGMWISAEQGAVTAPRGSA